MRKTDNVASEIIKRAKEKAERSYPRKKRMAISVFLFLLFEALALIVFIFTLSAWWHDLFQNIPGKIGDILEYLATASFAVIIWAIAYSITISIVEIRAGKIEKYLLPVLRTELKEYYRAAASAETVFASFEIELSLWKGLLGPESILKNDKLRYEQWEKFLRVRFLRLASFCQDRCSCPHDERLPDIGADQHLKDLMELMFTNDSAWKNAVNIQKLKEMIDRYHYETGIKIDEWFRVRREALTGYALRKFHVSL